VTYFCDIDIHLKENFQIKISQPVSSVRALDPAIAFTSTANLCIASYIRRAKGVPSSIHFCRLPFSRYRRASVAPNFGSSANVRYISVPVTASARYAARHTYMSADLPWILSFFFLRRLISELAERNSTWSEVTAI